MQNGLSGNFILLSISSFRPKSSSRQVWFVAPWAAFLG